MKGDRLDRRSFLRTGAAALGATAAFTYGTGVARAAERRPNFVFVVCDQMNLDAMSYLGNAKVKTPNLDRLAQGGVTFMESHSTNPVCSPARSSLFTGRMPVETGVVHNDLPIRQGMPNLGEWLRDKAGYETVYCGKWHLPQGYAPLNLAGFRTLPSGGGQGALDDAWVSRTCEAYLRNRGAKPDEPFLLVASFIQPHDICYWMLAPETLVPSELPFPSLADRLPALPPNHKSFPDGPPQVGTGYPNFDTDLRWRYYLYCYYRMVEMLDSDVGRLLDALDQTGLAGNTVVVFTADHGEGAGRHSNVQKWHPYDESMKVPMLWACPSRIERGLIDRTHLVSGLDVMSTLCDYIGVEPPPNARGLSLRPLLEGKPAEWRDHLVCDWKAEGKIVRTPQYKLVTYANEPKVQLFDMQQDPWEMNTLAGDARFAATIEEHRKLLEEWTARMEPAPTQE
jgi:arylsulfatase A-like enzyme